MSVAGSGFGATASATDSAGSDQNSGADVPALCWRLISSPASTALPSVLPRPYGVQAMASARSAVDTSPFTLPRYEIARSAALPGFGV